MIFTRYITLLRTHRKYEDSEAFKNTVVPVVSSGEYVKADTL